MPDELSPFQTALADRYRIERELGRGGMATVYLAHDLRHGRPVALKVLHPHLAAVLGSDRFLREIRLCARLQHPHVLGVYDSGDAADRLWFTMPYVEGETLRSRLLRERQLPIGDALRITREIADGLDYAHQHGVIHRDIKPENVLLAGRHALLADFGIARALTADTGERLTETGMSLGTPHYMSPEQAMGQRDLDQRSDIYSLGCVLYEMLAGEPPFTGPTPQAILAKRLTEPVPHLRTVRQVPEQVERAVSRALASSPADRFGSAAEFAEALDSDSSREVPPPIKASTAPGRRRLDRRLVGAAGALLLFLILGYFLGPRVRPAGAPLASAAVLPFLDLSPTKDQEYFSDGLTEELITSLSQVKGLRVAARTSSFQFKGRNPDVHEVGRKLDVAAVLEGSVRKSGNRIRISTQLINAKDGYQLWSDSYDRNLSDVFAVQEEIARSIVNALRLRLAPGPDSALATKPTENLRAYDLYLKGLFAWNQRTGASLMEAVRYLEQAVALDRTFARAWAALADAYLLVVPYAGGKPSTTWKKAQAAAKKALSLDSTSAEAYTSLAYGSFIYGWEWPVAEDNFRRAIAADPNYATGHHWYADFLAGRGRLEEALSEFQRAHQLDPLSLQIGTELGWAYYLMHQNDQASRQLHDVLELEPNYAQGQLRLGLVQIQQRDYSDAITSIRRSIELGVFYPHAAAPLALAYARSGDRSHAFQILHELERRKAAGELVPEVFLAVTYGALGDRKHGMEWLFRAIDVKDIYVPENFFEPMLDPLRADPSFERVRERMGFRRSEESLVGDR